MAEFAESAKTIELVQRSTPDKTPSPQYLSVDETKRPRANSDPVGLHIHISNVPEITVTGDDCRDGGRPEDDENDSFLIPPSPRRRANTCPEDMFRTRKGRPPTPPPTDIRILRTPAGKRFSFNFNPKDISSISFAHHKLSKVNEEKTEQQQKINNSQITGLTAMTTNRTCTCYSSTVQSSNVCATTASGVISKLQSPATLAESTTEHCCNHCVSTQLSGLSVSEKCVTGTTNNNEKPLAERAVDADVLTSSPDSWRSKDNSRDNLDSQSLRAY